MTTSIRRQSPEKIQQIPIIDTKLNNHSLNDDDDDDENLNTHQPLNIITPQRHHIRQISNADSVQSGILDSTSRPSSISPNKINNQQKLNFVSTYQQTQSDEKVSHRTSSIASSSRRSSDRFPPPPQNLEIFDPTINSTIQHRSISSNSYQSSINDDVHTPEVSIITNIISIIYSNI
jgi:hypothetical protein